MDMREASAMTEASGLTNARAASSRLLQRTRKREGGLGRSTRLG
jgi:hypothetical protein